MKTKLISLVAAFELPSLFNHAIRYHRNSRRWAKSLSFSQRYQRKENHCMPFEKFDLENLDKERRKAVANSVRTMSVEELKALGNEIFRYADDPWREKFFRFIAENPGATFHHAVMSDGVNIVYCRDQDKGMWFLPGSGMGPLQATGRKMMSEIIRGKR